MIDLYKNIKARREELNMTQSQLAEKAGYADKSMIAKIEKGQIDLAQSKIQIIASALETTPKMLMGWNDSAPAQRPVLLYSDEKKLLTNYRKLNGTGRAKAQEDVEDLTQIPKYSADITLIQAAHQRTDVDMPEGVDASDDTYFD